MLETIEQVPGAAEKCLHRIQYSLRGLVTAYVLVQASGMELISIPQAITPQSSLDYLTEFLLGSDNPDLHFLNS